MGFLITLLFFIILGALTDTDSEYLMLTALLLGIYFGTIVQCCLAYAKVYNATREGREQMREETRKQEKEDNDYGIIEYDNDN